MVVIFTYDHAEGVLTVASDRGLEQIKVSYEKAERIAKVFACDLFIHAGYSS